MGAGTVGKNKHKERIDAEGNPVPRRPMKPNAEKRAEARNPNGPKTKQFGNVPMDRDWMEKEIAEGRLWSIDPAEWDLPWDSWYMHDATADEIYADWAPPTFRRRSTVACSSVSFIRDHRGRYIVDRDGQRLYRPCHRAASIGMNCCEKHGGAAPQMREKARQRLAYAADRAAALLEDMLSPVDENGTPLEARDRIKAASLILDRAGVATVNQIDVSVKAPAYEGVLAKLFSDENGEDDDGADDGE